MEGIQDEPPPIRGADFEPERREALIGQIYRAFRGVKRGRGVTLHEAVALDGYAPDEEQRAARHRDTERRWQAIPDAVLGDNNAIFSFLDACGFRYYIPAYMIWELTHIDGGYSGTGEVFSGTSVPEPDDIWGKYTLQRFSILNKAQSRAVCAFLRYYADWERYAEKYYYGDWIDEEAPKKEERFDGHSPEGALRHYWGKFCKNSGVRLRKEDALRASS